MDVVRDNMLELRKTLHHMAYQHKTVKKLECHMIDILKALDEHVYLIGVGGRKLKMSEAAVECDVVAYPKLVDTYIEGKLIGRDDPLLADAAAEYERRVMRRDLMRLVADWDMPYGEDTAGRPDLMPLPTVAAVISGVHACYERQASALRSAGREAPVVMPSDLRCQVASIHTGMKDLDPITRVLFHNAKTLETKYIGGDDGSATPARHKVWIFWNPPAGHDSDITVQRLTRSFVEWATSLVEKNGKKRSLKYKASCPEDADVLDAAGDRLQPCTPSPRPRANLDISIQK
jgi:hypothetical protein